MKMLRSNKRMKNNRILVIKNNILLNKSKIMVATKKSVAIINYLRITHQESNDK
jgi:hypothetical protein